MAAGRAISYLRFFWWMLRRPPVRRRLWRDSRLMPVVERAAKIERQVQTKITRNEIIQNKPCKVDELKRIETKQRTQTVDWKRKTM
jgi:hypothetical protein